MVQWAKDPVLPLPWLRFDPWELLHAMGAAKKKKRRENIALDFTVGPHPQQYGSSQARGSNQSGKLPDYATATANP